MFLPEHIQQICDHFRSTVIFNIVNEQGNRVQFFIESGPGQQGFNFNELVLGGDFPPVQLIDEELQRFFDPLDHGSPCRGPGFKRQLLPCRRRKGRE